MTNERLRVICIKNNWFTCGCNAQYEKLFDMNESGASVDDLATVIWICSDGLGRSPILKALTIEELPPISISSFRKTLEVGGWDDEKIELVIRAVEGSIMNEKDYKTI